MRNANTVEKLNPRNCSCCRFWDPKPGAVEIEPHHCHRNPPSWRTSKIDPTIWFSAFPETFNDDWCGSWKQRKGAVKQPERAQKPLRPQSRRALKK
jgi:hypothetical protein